MRARVVWLKLSVSGSAMLTFICATLFTRDGAQLVALAEFGGHHFGERGR